MQNYINQYRTKETKDLQRLLKPLSGQPDPVAKARIKAINTVLEEREGKKPIVNQQPKTLDEIVANKFLSKLRNARERGLEFTLTLSDIKRLMTRKTCYYTGMKLEDDCADTDPRKRTLERLDQNKGYTKENTVACCHAANSLKNMIFEDPTSKLRMTKAQFKRFSNLV